MEKYRPPKYVKLNGTAMRLADDEKWYYRHAGQWEVEWRYKEGKLLSWHWRQGHDWLHRVELIEITEAEWRSDNKGYI